MPGTPAFTQTRTASITLGTFPPREFRSVATLLTLTESLIMDRPHASSAQMHLQRLHDFCGHCLYFTAVLAFQHDAHQRLGAGEAHEQTAVPAQAVFHLLDD